MHQPNISRRPSIYYDYKIYPFKTPPERTGTQRRHPVVIVGAGPIGLVTALDLARYQIPVVLLNSEQQVSEGSRALAYTRRSMEILQQVGVACRITEHGLAWRYGNSFFRGQRVFRLDVPYDEDDRFPPLTNLQQQYLEEYLVDLIEKEPLVDLRWGNKAVSLTQHEDHVLLQVDTPEGEYTLETQWLVAADGARSAIRREMDLRMDGSSYEGRFVIADIRADLGLPTERLAFFDPDWNPGNTVLMHREPHGIWRIDYQLPAGESPEDALRPESLKSRIDAQLAMIGKPGIAWELDWCSVYSARAMTLLEYEHGRVIFTGDAAHMLPIFGVRGANTGWQDCQNLVWKLAMAIRNAAGPRLLPSYSTERVTAAREIIDEASKSVRFMSPPSYGFRMLRDAALSLSLCEEFVRPLLNWRTSRPHEYRESALNAQDDDCALFPRGPAKGSQICNIKLGTDNYLFDHLGASLYLLLFTHDDTVPPDLADAVRKLRSERIPMSILLMAKNAVGMLVTGADIVLHDATGHAHEKYGATQGFAAYLVRPDQHVCARWLSLDSDRLLRAAHIALGHL